MPYAEPPRGFLAIATSLSQHGHDVPSLHVRQAFQRIPAQATALDMAPDALGIEQLLLVNGKDELFVAQHGAYADLASFGSHTDIGTRVAVLCSGEEEPSTRRSVKLSGRYSRSGAMSSSPILTIRVPFSPTTTFLSPSHQNQIQVGSLKSSTRMRTRPATVSAGRRSSRCCAVTSSRRNNAQHVFR